MKLHNEPFELIKSGKKIIELRLYDEKRQKIKVGDVIEFCNVSSNEKMGCVVKCLHIYPSFKELYDVFDKERLGYKENEIPNPKDMEKFYLKEEIEQFGVVGIEIKKIEEERKKNFCLFNR